MSEKQLLPDVPSVDDEEPSSKVTPKITPPVIRNALLMIVLIIPLSVAGYFLFFTSEESPTTSSPQSFEMGGNNALGEGGGAEDQSTITSLTNKVDDLSAYLGSLKENITTLTENGEVLSKQLNVLASTTTDKLQVIDELSGKLNGVIDRLPDLSAVDQMVDAELNRLKSLIAKNQQRISAVNQARDQMPPFTLASIDEWGATSSAMLVANGVSVAVSSGGVHAGWRITRIVPPGCIYVTRVTEPKEVSLCLAGDL